jgi:hypothetical protein
LASWKCVFSNRSNPHSMLHTKLFDCLEVSKCVFIWNVIYNRVPLVCCKKPSQLKFHHLTRLQSVTYTSLVLYINMVLILRTKKGEKSLLETSRFNLSTENGGIVKMHFGELKMRFFPTAPIHIICYIRNDFVCLEFSKCVFSWNMNYIRVPPIFYKSYPQRNFYQLTRL